MSFENIEVGELPTRRPGKKSIPYTEDPEILARLSQVGDLMLKGKPAFRIAEELGQPLGSTKRDIARVKALWRKAAKDKLSDQRDVSLAQYRLTITKAWELVEAKPDKADRFLAVIIRAQERIDSLLGTEAPEVFEINGEIKLRDIDAIRRERWAQVREALGVIGDVDVHSNPGG